MEGPELGGGANSIKSPEGEGSGCEKAASTSYGSQHSSQDLSLESLLSVQFSKATWKGLRTWLSSRTLA